MKLDELKAKLTNALDIGGGEEHYAEIGLRLIAALEKAVFQRDECIKYDWKNMYKDMNQNHKMAMKQINEYNAELSKILDTP